MFVFWEVYFCDVKIFGTINLKLLIPIEIHVAKINNENLTHAFFYILCGKNWSKNLKIEEYKNPSGRYRGIKKMKNNVFKN